MSAGHHHQPDPTVGAGTLEEIAMGVFAWLQPDGSWWINNAGAVANRTGTLIIDTCATEARTRRFLAEVALVTKTPIRFAVNTHEHGDHTYGNSVLPEDTTFFGHENMRAALLADPVIEQCPPVWSPTPDWGDITKRVPEVTIRDDLTLYSDDLRVELRHPGYPAHTTGDLVAWLPEERVLFAGDLIFNGLTPLVLAGSVNGARRCLDWLAALEPDLLVPGHGPLVPADDLARVLGEHERYYRFVADLAKRGRRERLSPLDAAASADLGEFGGWADAERLVLNLHRAYADAAGRPLDVTAAFTDAIAYNGGPLTTHVCCTA